MGTGTLIGGRYRLDAVLGRGGMGVVWAGVDTLLERPVALKEIRFPPALDDEERLRYQGRVLREARAAARLNHRGVVTVYDVVDEGDQPYIVMELVRAPSLAEVVAERGPLPPSRVAGIGAGIAEALAAAHRAGIVHRDVKPGNVLVPDHGPARLTDFGIASVTDDTAVTTTHRLVGSPSYMSPEQAAGGTVDEATDRWSLGAALYYAVEGVPPYDRGEAIPTLTSVLSDPPRPPERAGTLGPTLLALLAKEPGERPTDDQLVRRLRAAAEPAQADDRHPTAANLASTTAVIGPEEPRPVDTGVTSAAGASVPVRRGAPAQQEIRAADAAVRATPIPLAGGQRRSQTLVALAAVTALLVVAAGIALFLARRTPAHPATPAAASSPNATGAPAVTTPASTAPPAVPATWVSYHDPATGFTISHPAAWTVSTNGSITDFRDPATGSYLRVDHISPPHADAAADWRAYEPSFAASNPGYQRIQITPTTFDGFPAATWEYTYGGNGTLHAVDLGFIVGSRYGFALNFQTPGADWQRLQPEFQTFQRSFRAPTG